MHVTARHGSATRATDRLHASTVARVIRRRRGAPRRASAVVRRRRRRAIDVGQNVRASPLHHGPRRRRMAPHRLPRPFERHVLEVRTALPFAPHARQAALIPARDCVSPTAWRRAGKRAAHPTCSASAGTSARSRVPLARSTSASSQSTGFSCTAENERVSTLALTVLRAWPP